MTKAVFYYQSSKPQSFVIEGHAGFADRGQDIVCSSITTAVFTTLNLIASIMKEDEYLLHTDEDKGIIQFELKGEHPFVYQVIKNLEEVLSGISDDYPKNLKIIIKNKPNV